MKQETRWLLCNLSESEKQIKAEELAKQIEAHTAIEEEKKASAASFSAQLKESSAKLKSLAGVVGSGKEKREVPVYKIFYSAEGLVKYFRVDTDEFVEYREMTEKERQMHLFERDEIAERSENRGRREVTLTAESFKEPEAANTTEETKEPENGEIEPTDEEIREALDELEEGDED